MIPFIHDKQVASLLPYPRLIERLRTSFNSKFYTPKRIKYNYKSENETLNTLLYMPAWHEFTNIGVKLITVSPENNTHNLPAVQGIYILFDYQTGRPELLIEAKKLTTIRTSAVSALASSFLSRKNSSIHLVIGTGALSYELIKAHRFVRDIRLTLVWGRDYRKAMKVATECQIENVQAIEKIEDAISKADIISCATLSPTPIIKGNWLLPGQHLDLVGSYLPETRESDDETVKRSSIYIDVEHTKIESGDLKIPLDKGIITEEHILDDLFGLCNLNRYRRKADSEITFFKSTGHALEDLTAAQLIKEQLGYEV